MQVGVSPMCVCGGQVKALSQLTAILGKLSQHFANSLPS